MASQSDNDRIVLGDEFDARLRSALSETLRELDARPAEHLWGLGGSQEVERSELEVQGKAIVVEAETYLGLSIGDNARLVALIAAMVRQRMSV